MSAHPGSTAPLRLLHRIDLPRVYVVVTAALWLFSVVASMSDGHLAADPVRGTYIVSFLAILCGELARIRLVDEREAAPMAVATALAFAFYTQVPGGNVVVYSGRDVFAIAGLAMASGIAVLAARGRDVRLDEAAARLVAVGVAATTFRDIPLADGETLAMWFGERPEAAGLWAVVMLAISVFALAVYAITMGLLNAARNLTPVQSSVVAEVRALVGLSAAIGATGALLAAAAVPMGLYALPLTLVPLVFTLFAVRQHAAIRMTQRETIKALSRLTDVAGYTLTGHAARVARVGVAVGRDLGMTDNELRELEYAALLHDLGQICLVEPIPAGATVMAAPPDQDQIAADGAEILRRAGVLPEVADTLLAQATPYRQVREFDEDIPMASRIIKVANAYDDFVHVLSAPDRPAAAIERMHLGLGYEYDPRVVDALVAVIDRRRPLRPRA